MPFGTISIGAGSYTQSLPGIYRKSTVEFGDPRDEVLFKPGVYNPKTGVRTSNIYRTIQMDVGDPEVRKSLVLHLGISVPSDGSFSSTAVYTALQEFADAITADRINRNLSGEI